MTLFLHSLTQPGRSLGPFLAPELPSGGAALLERAGTFEETMTDTIDRDVELSIARASAVTNQVYFFDVNGVGGTLLGANTFAANLGWGHATAVINALKQQGDLKTVAQPLARNVGEALGVGAIAPLRSDMQEPLPAAERFRSSVDIAGLTRIEHALQMLQPPRWPESMADTT